MKIKTSIIIEAPAERVWHTLTDFESYPKWNPFVLSLTGDVAVGNTINITLPQMKFTPVVLDFIPEKKFTWKGKLWMKGIFDGEHSFELIQVSDIQTRFNHSEKFTGILVPLFTKMLLTKTKQGFIEMNEALKKRVEKKGIKFTEMTRKK